MLKEIRFLVFILNYRIVAFFQQQDVCGRIQDHPAGYKKVKIIIWPDMKKVQIIRPDIWCLSRPVFRIRVILSGSGSDFFS